MVLNIAIILFIIYILYNIYFKNYKENKQVKLHEEYQHITPQTFYNFIGKSNTACVNTLSDDFVLNTNPLNINNSYGKNFINNQKISKFNKIILYCANYTCGASHKYAKSLISKGYSKKNIILYSGGIHEWVKYCLLYPNNFTIYSLKSNNILETQALRRILVDFSHISEKQRIKSFNENIPQEIVKMSGSENFFNNLSFPNSISCNSKLLDGKVCVVTGGTSGLGLTAVYSMLNNGAKHVTLTYYNNIERANSVDQELSSKFDRSRFYVLRADARTVEGNHLTFNRNQRESKLNLYTGGINCVDINAGIFGPANLHKKHVHNISVEDYKEVIELNLNAYFLGIKHFVKQAIENNVVDASIVCIKSIYGSTGSLFSNIAYQTSKHGVMGLVRQSAIELARSNEKLKLKYPIRINAVSPTFTDTALTKPLLDADLVNETISNGNPTGNLANKQHIADAVIYLLSDNSKSITGIDLPVDCGVLAESIPTYEEVKRLNDADIETLSCCGDTL